MPAIGFLGFGNMAQALSKGIIESGFVSENEIHAYDTDKSQIEKFGKNIVSSDNALQVTQEAKYVFLCIKPQVADVAIGPIVSGLTENHVIVSILAGVSVKRIKSLIGGVCPVVRVMPNTPMLLGCGATAISKPQGISDTDYSFLINVFKCVGTVYEIPGNKFNEVIPVNGSSPAFIYLFAKIVAESAAKYGLDYKTSLDLFSDTLIGSARMLKESGISADKLIEMVASKGGTTEAALETMLKLGFSTAVESGFDSCVGRAYELGKDA